LEKYLKIPRIKSEFLEFYQEKILGKTFKIPRIILGKK
jgi:hypothetical protein